MNLVNFYDKSIKSAYINITAIPSIWEIVWGIGMMITAIYFIYKYIKALKVYKEALPINTQFFNQWKEKHSLNRNYRIKELEKISSPLTYSFINPVILIPKSILVEEIENMEYILLHEWNHIKRWDI